MRLARLGPPTPILRTKEKNRNVPSEHFTQVLNTTVVKLQPLPIRLVRIKILFHDSISQYSNQKYGLFAWFCDLVTQQKCALEVGVHISKSKLDVSVQTEESEGMFH
jgi:hypothetical protein